MSTRPLSIMMFCNTVVRSGVEEHILELLRGLDRRHFLLYLACPEALLQQYGSDIPGDVRVAPILLDSLADIRGGIRLAQTLRQHKIDILHCHMFRASLFSSPIARLCGVPVVIETTHVRETWRKGWLKSKFVVDRIVGHLINHYIAVSEANARYLTNQKRVPARKVHIIRNGCHLEKFDPERHGSPAVRASLGFGEHDPVLVALARLEPQKGHHVLLDAMPTVLREFPNVRLVCVGDGVLRESLEQQADSLGVGDAVRFVGYQSNPQDWLALADFCVLPSYYEGLPLVAIESLAAGRTMVATAVDGTPDVIVDEKTGLTVPPGDSQRMAQAICTLLRKPELRESLAQAGRRHVLENFSAERFVRDTAQLYLNAWNCRIQHLVSQAREQEEEKQAESSDTRRDLHTRTQEYSTMGRG